MSRIADWIARYGEYMERRGFAVRSQETYKSYLKHFLAFLDEWGISAPVELTRQVVADYQAALYTHETAKGRPWSLKTQAGHLLAMKSFMKFLVKEGALLLNPADTLEFPQSGPRNPPKNVPTLEEVERLLEAPNPHTNLGVRDRAILEILYATGMRVGELCALRVYDVDLSRGCIQIVAGKGGKDRVVPIGQKATDAIRDYLERIRPRHRRDATMNRLFLSDKGNPIRRGVVGRFIHIYRKKAEIQRTITAHSLRHACATHMLHGQASIRHIQQLLGHKQLSTTQLYTHVEIEDLKAVHQKTHPREKGSSGGDGSSGAE